MFLSVYKTTVKSLFRSFVFWCAFVFLIFIAVNSALNREQSYYDIETNETINNMDPRFILTYDDYVQLVSNTCSASIMLYALPIFAVTTVVLVLTRDYGDGFFEIEKSCGQKPLKYCLGRLSALVSINMIACMISSFLSFHLFVYISGGVDEWGLGKYLADSTVKLLRYLFCVSAPTVLLFISFTYMIGNILKSGTIAGAVGFAYVLLNYLLVYPLRFRIPQIYGSYLSPTPNKLRFYFHCYDTVNFEHVLKIYQTSQEKALLCFFILIGLSVVYLFVSYCCLCKRDI